MRENSEMGQSGPLLDDIVLYHARSVPSKTAIIYRDHSVTYHTLAKRVDSLCLALQGAGVKAGDFVVVLLPPSIEITVSLLSISRLGAIYAPLDPDHPDVQLRARCADINPACIVTTPELEPRVHGWAASVLIASRVPLVDNAEFIPQARTLAAPACIFFTSGTTGEPKGVLGSFLAMREAVVSPVRFLGIGQNDILNSIARYAWSISMLELLAPLVVGGTSLLLDRSQALNLDWLKENAGRCTAFHCPPALLRKLSDHVEENYQSTDYFHNARLVWYGGDTFSEQHIEKLQKVFPNAIVGTAYGCTEIFGLSHCYLYPRGEKVNKVLVGKPVDSISQTILNSEGKPARVGEEGQIFLAGQRIALQYWQQPELTAKKFIELDGVRHYATGDFGRLDGGGNLEFLQRRDSQVKIRGIRIELGEIEFNLHRLPGVKEAVVLAVATDSGEKELRGYIIGTRADLDLEALRARLEQNLPEYMVPARLYQLEVFPVTENFKVDKKALADYAPPTSEGEFENVIAQKIAAIWKQVTGQAPESMESNFFQSGGDSLSAARLAALLGREFGRTVEVAEIYRASLFKAQVIMFDTEPTTASFHAVTTDALVATQAQKGLIFRELLESKHTSITCTRYIRRAEGFDGDLLKQALAKLVDRFPTLKTHIRFEGRQIKLVENKQFDGRNLDVTFNSGVWTLQSGKNNSLAKVSEKFDLKNDPLIKARVSHLDDGSQILQLTAHHVAADDNSMGRLAGDFIEIYDALLNHRRTDLPPVLLDYREFASEQQERILDGFYSRRAHATSARLLDYLPDCRQSPLLNLNDWNDRRALSRDIPVSQANETKYKARFTDYVAALSWSIHRYFGRQKLVFCAHVALRRDSKDAPRVGMFVNLVPVFTGVDPNHSVEQHVQRTQADLDEAMSRSDVPYELILSDQKELKTLGRFPFDAFINELRFDNVYPVGYQDVIVSRAFATDANEISMSLVRGVAGDSIKLECPHVNSAPVIAEAVGKSMVDFIHSLASAS